MSDHQIPSNFFTSLVNMALRFIFLLAKNFHPLNLAIQKKIGMFWQMSFLIGAIYPGIIPHARTWNPFGFLSINPTSTKDLAKVANKNENGIASFWLGVFPGFYLTKNASRNVLVREELIGVTTDGIRGLYKGLVRNNVMVNFLIWQNINSEMYKQQRRFLDVHFKKDLEELLPTIEEGVKTYTKTFIDGEAVELRRFVYGLVLHIGSRLPVICLSKSPLDSLFLEDRQFEDAIYRVAQYGIAQAGDSEFEAFLYDQFVILFKENFEEISQSQDNLMKNIFKSRNIDFPNSFEEFESFDKTLKHEIGMNFLSIAIGGMVHTTANSFDWLLANLATTQKDTLNRIRKEVDENDGLSLTNRDTFEKSLRNVRDVVISNVLINPTFTHELFVCGNSFSATLSSGEELYVQKGNLILVNYLECNRQESYCQTDDDMRTFLDSSSAGGLSLNKRVASFGGSVMNRTNKKSRICPGRDFSLYEQMVMLSRLLKDFEITFFDVDISVDDAHFPVHARKSDGKIKIQPRIDKHLETKDHENNGTNDSYPLNIYQQSQVNGNNFKSEKSVKSAHILTKK